MCRTQCCLPPHPGHRDCLLLLFLLSGALLLARHLAVTRLASPDCRALLSLPLARVVND